jgi:hypothetical protein
VRQQEREVESCSLDGGRLHQKGYRLCSCLQEGWCSICEGTFSTREQRSVSEKGSVTPAIFTSREENNPCVLLVTQTKLLAHARCLGRIGIIRTFYCDVELSNPSKNCSANKAGITSSDCHLGPVLPNSHRRDPLE